MSFDADDEILQDFLVEAWELLEQLGEQLVDLERAPQDYDLLNAVFRSFHTIKGGAGFLNVQALVEICHHAEDVFNVLRQGERQIDAHLMDTVLRVLDIVNDMMADLRAASEPQPADPQVIEELKRYAVPDTGETPAETTAAASEAPAEASADQVDQDFEKMLAGAEQGSAPQQESANVSVGGGDEITEEEFEALLDQMQGGDTVVEAKAEAASQTAASSSDEISDDEFENLLDQMHGKGQGPKATGQADASAAIAKPPAADADNITDDEFEALLDNLQGKAQPESAPAASASQAAKPVAAEAAPAPAPKAAPAANKRAAAKENSGQAAETTVRVDTRRLDDIMNMVGELVLVRNRLATLRSVIADEEVAKAVANLDLVTADLQNSVMKTRMQPIKKVFGRFPRVVRDLARSLKKEVSLELQGEETDLDKNLVEALADPLVHLVRNAVDHGVESPEEREKVGKPRCGTVVLAAEQEGDHILLSIEDDGKGMDPDAIRRSAVEKGVLDEDMAARLDDRECFNLIFAPGFSTKTEISDVSGRGVGMDVVKTRITQLNGSIDINSVKGRGSRLEIKVPLTLAIMPTLNVMLGNQIFALPLSSVNEIFNLEAARTNIVDGQLSVIVRNRAIPLFYLREWLVSGADRYERPEEGYVVVVTVGTQYVGCVVDQLIGQEEVVIKPLGALLQGTPGLAGATITGNGRIALIVDLPGLMSRYA